MPRAALPSVPALALPYAHAPLRPAPRGHHRVIRLRALGVLLALTAVAACEAERLRPGPPTLELEMPPGNVVTSPDTFVVGIFARDDNGLDSLVVSFLDQVRDISVFNEIEVVDGVFFVVPEGYAVGEVLEVSGFVRDLSGERTTVTGSVTVGTGASASR